MENPSDWASSLVKETMGLAKDINDLSKDSTAILHADINFIKTVFPKIKGSVQKIEKDILNLSNDICTSLEKVFSPLKDPYFDYGTGITDILDDMLENIDKNLDVFYNRQKESKIAVKEPVKSKKRLQLEEDTDKISKLTDNNIFIPEAHPYKEEILSLYKNSNELSSLVEEISCIQDMKTCPAEWISTPEALTRMAITLENQKVIAVDLENHSFYSYHGFSCLVQISSPTHDYLIDVIALRKDFGLIMRSIFANSSILKVFHGAQSDIQWLQRDFNIFVVNMLDTFFAAKALQLPAQSLAYLLSHYVNIETDKQYQLADWRVRPIPEAMSFYAQMDTHYLLHIQSVMQKELIEKGGLDLLLQVLQRSTQSALSLYRPESFDLNGCKSILNKNTKLTDREISIIKALYCWRENVAVEEDISPPSVMPNYVMVKIAQSSFVDPEVILRGLKHNLNHSMKHLDSMKLAIENRSEVVNESIKKKSRVEKEESPSPVHIKFPDSDTSDKEEIVENLVSGSPSAVLVAKFEEKPVQSRVKMTGIPISSAKPSLMGMFATRKPILPFDQKGLRETVANKMNIVRVQSAGAFVQKTSENVPIDSVAEPETETLIQKDSSAKILRSGVTVIDAEILDSSNRSDRISLSVKKTNKPLKKDVMSDNSVDLQSASLSFVKGPEAPVKTTKVTRPVTVVPDKLAVNSNIRTPRIGTAPKSGNRTMTFK